MEDGGGVWGCKGVLDTSLELCCFTVACMDLASCKAWLLFFNKSCVWDCNESEFLSNLSGRSRGEDSDAEIRFSKGFYCPTKNAGMTLET